MPISLRARVVYPVDKPAIDGGVVTIDGARIVAVGSVRQDGSSVCDLGDVALLPGLVNAHTHLEFSHLREPLGRPGMPLVEWLPLAIAERRHRSELASLSIAVGVQECLLAGTCAVGEIATTDASAYPAESPIILATFLEAIGFSQARMASALVAVEARFGDALESSQRRRGLTSEQVSEQIIGVSPHAPYTVSPSLLQSLVLLAKKHSLPVAMHLAESEEEVELLATGSGRFQQLLEERSMWDPHAIPRALKPIHYLQWLAEAPRSLVIHGNYLDREEHIYLAEHAERMTVVYCSRTHAYFAHPRYPLAQMLAAGVRVALGTDSRASNPDLGMLGEMRYVAQRHSDVPPETILRMATLGAAGALGCDNNSGSITPGKLANLIAIPMHTGSLCEALTATDKPAAVWLRGREV